MAEKRPLSSDDSTFMAKVYETTVFWTLLGEKIDEGIKRLKTVQEMSSEYLSEDEKKKYEEVMKERVDDFFKCMDVLGASEDEQVRAKLEKTCTLMFSRCLPA